MTYYRKVVGELCYLSPCSPEDADHWACWLNDIEVALPLGDEAYTVYGLGKAERDLADITQSDGSLPVFTIVDLKTDAAIGRCLLFDVDALNRSAKVGIFIGEKDFWGRGIGQEAIRLLLDYGFNLLNLHSVMLGAFSFNVRAVEVYRKVGFQEIGLRRQARIVAGKAYDVVMMDMLEDEFRDRYGSALLRTISSGAR